MPKQKIKSVSQEFVHFLDRMPEREVFSSRRKDAFRAIAGFYGFEQIRVSPVEEYKTLLPLSRAGLFEERPPFLCKSVTGMDMAVNFSPLIGLLRAYRSHKMNDFPHPLKLMFDGDYAWLSRAGEMRSCSEFGFAMVGEEGPIAEAEIIQIICKSLEESGIHSEALELKVNATGCSECRQSFRSAFTSYFRPKAHRLCKNCKRHFKKNPTKILFCEEDQCKMLAQNAPQIIDYLCEICKRHLRGLLEFLDEAKIPYFLDTKFFKDGTPLGMLVFEISIRKKEEQKPVEVLPVETPIATEAVTVAADVVSHPTAVLVPETAVQPVQEEIKIIRLAFGGRASKAGELIVGRKLDVACGIIDLDGLGRALGKRMISEGPRVFLAQLGDLAKKKSLALLENMRLGGISVQESLGRDSVKSQLKIAEKIGAEIALIFGQKEALDGTIIVREIQSGIQETIPQEKLIEFLKRKLRRPISVIN